MPPIYTKIAYNNQSNILMSQNNIININHKIFEDESYLNRELELLKEFSKEKSMR